MANQKRISIVGHFGGQETLLDGQSVKTKTFYQELADKTDWYIWKVDTYYRHKAPWKLVWQLLVALVTTRDIIISTSQNGRRFFFPILYFFARFFRTRVYHSVIGAHLAKYISEYPIFIKYLNSFVANWVETSSLKRGLEATGVTNAKLMPNFKRLKIATVDQHIEPPAVPYRLCTFSRVMKEKGIEDAVRAVTAINEQSRTPIYTLDIFGPVDPEQKTWFENLRSNFPPYVSYCGEVHYEDSVETLKNYFALLFPTRFFTEGVPGTVIDAYAAGLPVIASRWESFSDVIDHGVTGYGYEFGKEQALCDLLTEVAKNPDMVLKIKNNCIKRARNYMPEESVKQIIDTITAAEK